MKVFAVCGIVAMLFVICYSLAPAEDATNPPAGDKALGTQSYDKYASPDECQDCHVDIYQQWTQAMMSVAYTHHWDEIEYFNLAVPHAEVDEKVAGVKAGCNGCHAPLAFLAGDIPPPRPSENSRANESVSCDICHTIAGFEGDTPYNFNFISTPGDAKFGPKANPETADHEVKKVEFLGTAEFCGTCHNEKSPYGAWVKATHLEWKEGPYAKAGVTCQTCHMPRARGVCAEGVDEEWVPQHLFHGAHDKGKLAGAVEMRMHPAERTTRPGGKVIVNVQLFNAKAGHKIPTGSVEDRIMWLHVTAKDAAGKTYHLPVDKKGFEGEEYTIAADTFAYQDMGVPLGNADFAGVQRDGVPVGDRIFRMPYFDPQGRMTIMQWNTASFGADYRIGPRETKIETFTWEIPADIAPGEVTFEAELNYQKLVQPVAEFLGVPEEEAEIVVINTAQTSVTVAD
jgi:nitrate/TMAO reductase-like tetraheme cytochrome c subunit